ncbi:MAG: hypothetical protein M1536_03980 [Firmicutes bacterium]|nr:hypothetical protein [Bacillota bacterium]
MKDDEKGYLGKIELIIEEFGTIQRNFVLDKNGVRAIVKFVQELEGKTPVFALDDPVVQKGKQVATKVIEGLARQLEVLEKIKPPDVWTKFHESLISSLKLQLQGYREMAKVFDDHNPAHINKGQDFVSKGMGLLEAGNKEAH